MSTTTRFDRTTSMSLQRTRPGRPMLLAAVVVLLGASCSSDSDEKTTATSTPTTQTAPTTTAAPEPSTTVAATTTPDTELDLFEDAYSQDFTVDKDDFVAGDAGTYMTSYQADGYHLTVREPATWGPVGVKANFQHSALSAEIEVVLQADGAIGPFCWENPSHGYGFVVSGDGTAQIVRVDGSFMSVEQLSSGTSDAVAPGQAVHLMITCVRVEPMGPSDVRLGGYIDGTLVLEATAPAVEFFQFTGFAGQTMTVAPVEWTVTGFWRDGPESMPADHP